MGMSCTYGILAWQCISSWPKLDLRTCYILRCYKDTIGLMLINIVTNMRNIAQSIYLCSPFSCNPTSSLAIFEYSINVSIWIVNTKGELGKSILASQMIALVATHKQLPWSQATLWWHIIEPLPPYIIVTKSNVWWGSSCCHQLLNPKQKVDWNLLMYWFNH